MKDLKFQIKTAYVPQIKFSYKNTQVHGHKQKSIYSEIVKFSKNKQKK